MAQWYDTAYGLQFAEPEDVASWGGGTVIPSYPRPPGQGEEQGGSYQWDPRLLGREGWEAPQNHNLTGRVASQLLARLDKQASGQPLSPTEQWQWEETQRGTGVPTRDWRTLLMAGDPNYQESQRALYPGPSDPDYLDLLTQVHGAAQQGDPQAQAMLPDMRRILELATYNATVKQDPFSPMGDPFFGALGILGLGASAGAIAPLFAGGAGLGTTLGGLGALSGTLGQGAGLLGEALDVPGLRQAGTYLGALGGLAGGVGGLATIAQTGVQSLSDAAKVAQNVGRITGAVGRASGSDVLGQAAKYLGYAGTLGSVGSGLLPQSVTDWSGTSSPLAQDVAPQIDYSTSSAPLTPQDWSTQRGGGMADFSYDDFIGWGDPNDQPWNSPMPADTPGWEDFIGWDTPPQGADYPWNSPMPADTEGGGANWLSTLLGGAGGLAKTLLGGGGGGGGGLLGPLLSSLGSLGGGKIGSNAANEAARLQSQALNRGIDLQTAQWLQQQQNLAPYLQAGQQGLAQLQQLAGREQPALPGAQGLRFSREDYDRFLPQTTPGWQPQTYQGPAAVNAGDYRWTPGQGPRAQDYRYRPGQTPDAAQYASGPPQLYRGAMPGTQVPTLTGQQVLDQDPGAAFRQTEARKALEASALARGTGMSGSTLSALQRQSQDLASQEYGNAWQRMMARDTEQYGRNWGQYQQNWNQGVQETELGLRTNAQNFGQSLSAAELRERVNQVASQQGWSQAQAEAAFREGMAQQASQQGFNQALAGQQNQFTQGLETSKWNTLQQQQYAQELYKNMFQQNELQYGRDISENKTTYDRGQQQYRQQLGQHLLPWEQSSTLATLGGQAVGQYGQQGQGATNAISNLLGQLGTANALGPLGSAQQWNTALAGGVGGLQNVLRGLNA